MAIRLQKFGFRESQYERPTQKWVCGRSLEGSACPAGPDASGHCAATAECTPHRKGDRWLCSRSTEAGGACESGPTPTGGCSRPIPPCQPVLSLMGRRRLLSVWLSTLTVGGLVLVLAGPTGPSFITPGDLARPHAPITTRCVSCHIAASGRMPHWLAPAFAPGSGGQQAHLCLGCHDLGQNPLRPHGAGDEILRQASRRIAQERVPDNSALMLSLAAWISGGRRAPEAGLQCAICHREHRGPDSDLKTTDERRCHVCHTVRFTDFTRGHPEFSGYPYTRRTLLTFDHVSHISKHFKGERASLAPTGCPDCHLPGPGRRRMAVLEFEHSCARCHEAEIRGERRAGAKGTAFLRIPGLDVRALRERGATIGEWPEDAEGGPTSFMDFLLPPDEPTAAAIDTLSGLDLLDLSGATSEQLTAVELYAWAVKEFLFDLITSGHEVFRSRLTRMTGAMISTVDQPALGGSLSVDALREAQRRWFPGLISEIPAHRAGRRLPWRPSPRPGVAMSPGPRAEDWPVFGGWYVDDSDFSLRYRPSGHADRFLRAWLDLTGRLVGMASSRGAARIFSTLSGRTAVGLCAKCHSVDQHEDQRRSVNWTASSPDLRIRAFTRFSHGPHLGPTDREGCQTCHILNGETQVAASSNETEPVEFASNFVSMTKATCLPCHSAEAAGDACLTCHAYHVGEVAHELTRRQPQTLHSPPPETAPLETEDPL